MVVEEPGCPRFSVILASPVTFLVTHRLHQSRKVLPLWVSLRGVCYRGRCDKRSSPVSASEPQMLHSTHLLPRIPEP